MTFTVIPQGASVFVDANTFVFHFSKHPALAVPCMEFLDRVSRHELQALTSANVVSDVAHRLMALEAATSLGWTGTGISQRLRRHPAEVQKLTAFRHAVLEIPGMGVPRRCCPPGRP
jgi:predicted nucleic acid-binding protein